jgi:hypothetical protein
MSLNKFANVSIHSITHVLCGWVFSCCKPSSLSSTSFSTAATTHPLHQDQNGLPLAQSSDFICNSLFWFHQQAPASLIFEPAFCFIYIFILSHKASEDYYFVDKNSWLWYWLGHGKSVSFSASFCLLAKDTADRAQKRLKIRLKPIIVTKSKLQNLSMLGFIWREAITC